MSCESDEVPPLNLFRILLIGAGFSKNISSLIYHSSNADHSWRGEEIFSNTTMTAGGRLLVHFIVDAVVLVGATAAGGVGSVDSFFFLLKKPFDFCSSSSCLFLVSSSIAAFSSLNCVMRR
jgi:hypothetical protein